MHTLLTPTSRLRRLAIGLCCLCLFSVLAVPSALAQEKVTVQLKWLHHFQFAGYYAALEKGFYRKAGLEVVLVEGGPSMEVEQEVRSGRADFGVGTSALLLNRAQGDDFVVLGQIFQHSPAVLLVPRRTGIHSIAGMAGRRLMYSNQHGDMLALLHKNGIDQGAIQQVPHQGDPRDLITGRADVMMAYSFNEPYILEQAGEPYLTFSPLSYGIDFYGDNFFATRRTVTGRPEMAAAFREATLAGWRYAMAHKEEVVNLILSRYSKHKDRQWLMFEANQLDTLIQPQLVELGYQSPSRWQHIADTFKQLGMLPKEFDPEGIIYRPSGSGKYRMLLGTTLLFGTITVALAATLLAFRRLNRRLNREIREHRQAAGALEQSHTLLSTLSLQVPGVLFQSYLSPDGSFRTPYASDKTHEIYELSPSEIYADATAVFRRFHPDDCEHVLAGIYLSARELTPWECEYRVVLPRQGLKWLYGTALPQKLEDGGVVWYGIIMDITERKRAEAAMREKSELLDLAHDAIIVRDLDGTIHYWNHGAEAMYGYSAPQACGQSIHHLLATVFFCPREEINTRMLQHGHWEGLLSHTARDGSTIAAASRWVLQRSPEAGAPPGFIMEINSDVTERVNAEAELRRSEAKYRGLYESMMDGYGCCDMDGTLVEFNEALQQMVGYSREELLGLTYQELTPEKWHPLEERIIREQVLVRGYSDLFEKEYRHRDGTLLPVELRVCLFHDESGQPAGMWAVVRDISERKQLQNESLRMQKLESLGVLAGGIAHDFNNILTGVLGNISYAQLLLEREHKAGRILNQAEKASRRATELAQQLLSFARGSQPVKKSVSARLLLEASVSLVLSGSNVLSSIHLPQDLHPLDADEGQIGQVFNNIIINAAQAMPGGGTVTITAANHTLEPGTVSSLPPGDYVRFTFSDTGCGIPEDIQKKIFDPYFTTKAGGNGLGLASVYSIVTRHGGWVQVSSATGSGATFEILLPASHEEIEIREVQGMPELKRQRNGRVLVMDDEEIIRDLMADLLTELGYRPSTCASGEQAVSLYRTAHEAGEPYAAVLMDLTIPGGMGGQEAAGQILEQHPQACLIVSSGYSSDPVMAEYSSFGFSATLGKPYDVAEVVQVLDRLLPS